MDYGTYCILTNFIIKITCTEEATEKLRNIYDEVSDGVISENNEWLPAVACCGEELRVGCEEVLGSFSESASIFQV